MASNSASASADRPSAYAASAFAYRSPSCRSTRLAAAAVASPSGSARSGSIWAIWLTQHPDSDPLLGDEHGPQLAGQILDPGLALRPLEAIQEAGVVGSFGRQFLKARGRRAPLSVVFGLGCLRLELLDVQTAPRVREGATDPVVVGKPLIHGFEQLDRLRPTPVERGGNGPGIVGIAEQVTRCGLQRSGSARRIGVCRT